MPMKNELFLALRRSSRYPFPGLVVFRGEEEETFLRSWLSGQPSAPAQPESKSPAPRTRCESCGIPVNRSEPIGSGENGVMIIMNPPSLMSRNERKVFSADAENMKANIIRKALGLNPEECYITSMVKCAEIPASVRYSDVFGYCAEELREEIISVSPRIILVMGELLPMKKLLGEFRAIPVFTIDHPLVMAKNPDMKNRAWATLKAMMDRMKELGIL